ncbi:hypothetical protein EYF80_028153 [Liparis tanakae]|uniref:Uncharacterized protein n=1 Tax=Liparis tanakae TaxID=230148 RepID=A0A4Z2H6U8_9TELE|nr:hypothetical protein EYF80_028153 [Liparis tanakae]
MMLLSGSRGLFLRQRNGNIIHIFSKPSVLGLGGEPLTACIATLQEDWHTVSFPFFHCSRQETALWPKRLWSPRRGMLL